ncbi:MAG TPA: tetratricopeptide repeat protein [Thermodesulfovibrionales bacterium]|nr:tetratricopeptide repeat protein [Thermodesulfovibrionales bacterium]
MKNPHIYHKMAVFSFLIMFLTASCASTPKEDTLQKARAHYQLGVSYLNDNSVQPAFVEFQKALELNPGDKETLNAIGVIYLLKLEDYAKAIEFLQKALKVDKNYSEAWNNLGVAYEKTGKYDEAIEAYKAALLNTFYRNPEKALNNLGRVYYRMKRYDEAIDAYKEAAKRASDFALPYYGIALCYNASGRYGNAATALRKALELDPAYRGDKERAIRDLKERKVLLRAEEEKDMDDLLEIMNY